MPRTKLSAHMDAQKDFTTLIKKEGYAKRFPPVIGQVKARILQITHPQEMSEGEAWALAAKAIRNSVYDHLKEFEALPGDIQRIVGAPSQLRDWGTMDSDTVHSVAASNFQRAYRVKAEQRRKYDALPGEVKTLIGQIAAGKQMGIESHEH